jgi:hypothetical protein
MSKTKQEVRDEINELYGAIIALGTAMEHIHDLQEEKTKQMFALNQMIKDMKDHDE